MALGIGLNFVLPGGGALITAASAVAATLIPRFVNGLVMHGDLGKALGECVTGKALRAVVLSLVVPRGGAPAGSLDLVQHFVSGLQNALARLPFEYALGEADFRTCLTSGLLGAASDAVTGFAASHIGDLVHPGGSSQGGIPVPVSLGLHAVNGAAGAAIRGEDLLSGACGAALGEAAGMLYHHVRMGDLRPGTEEYSRAMSFGVDTARMAATLAAIPLGLDADTAARAAGTAAENNTFAVPVADRLLQSVEPEHLEEAAEFIEETAESLNEGIDTGLEEALAPLPEPYMDLTRPWVNTIEGIQEDYRNLCGSSSAPQGWDDPRMAAAIAGPECLPHPSVGPYVVDFATNFLIPPQNRLEAGLSTRWPLVGAALGKVGTPAIKGLRYLKNLRKVSTSGNRIPSVALQRVLASKTGVPAPSMGGTTTADLAASRFARGEAMRMQSSFHVPGGGPLGRLSSPASSSGPSTFDRSFMPGGLPASRIPTHPNIRAEAVQVPGMEFGKGIKRQGYPFEDFVIRNLPEGARLPAGFKTFDAYIEATRTAVSVKTMNTLSAAKLAEPKQVYWSLKRNVDKVAFFRDGGRSKGNITAADISDRRIELGIPHDTLPAQMKQINRAIEYARENGVTLNVTKVR